MRSGVVCSASVRVCVVHVVFFSWLKLLFPGHRLSPLSGVDLKGYVYYLLCFLLATLLCCHCVVCSFLSGPSLAYSRSLWVTDGEAITFDPSGASVVNFQLYFVHLIACR